MGWIEKEKQTSFETAPIAGLFFWDGDLMALDVKRDWTQGEKLAMIAV